MKCLLFSQCFTIVKKIQVTVCNLALSWYPIKSPNKITYYKGTITVEKKADLLNQ